MRYLGLVVAGTLVAAAGMANAAFAAPASLAPSTRGTVHVTQPPGSLGSRFIRRSSPMSPHIGLPGFSGFPSSAPVSPHIGLPGFSGFPQPTDNRFRNRFHHGHHGSDFAWGYWGGYDSDGYADTIPSADQFGFFAEGGEVTMDGDRPVYHYDRSYPYEYGGPRATPTAAASGLHCQVQSVWDEQGRSQVPVRVCRPD
jgi:hypothetical protein